MCQGELSSVRSATAEGVFQQLVACVTHLSQSLFSGTCCLQLPGNGAPRNGGGLGLGSRINSSLLKP